MSEQVELNHLPAIHGVLAEFSTPEELLDACHRAYANGYRRMDAYAPMPVEGLAEAVGFKKNMVAFTVLCGGIFGAVGGFTLLEWIAQIAYPHNVGGRPLNSWPSFIAITFECMVLCSAITSLLCVMFMNGLPKPYNPLFNVPRFSRASIDRFFLCIESADPKFKIEETAQFLREVGGSEVSIVPA
jgi:hypothetical protein